MSDSTQKKTPSFWESHTSSRWNTGIMSWIMSTDHKRIGILYGFSIFSLFLLAALLGLTIKLQKLYPAADGWQIIPPELYGQVFTLHGVIMIFLFILPGAPAVIGNLILPQQLGAKDVAFPRVNLLSLWIFWTGAILAIVGVLAGGADTGWTFTTPYSVTTKTVSMFGFQVESVSLVLFAAFVLGWGTILTGINFIITIHRMRAKGMGMFQMPMFSWAIYSTSWIQVLATPVVGITLLLLIIERILPIGIFDPTKGGDPVLFQHLFWIYSHPAVYIMVLPVMGIVSEIVATNSQKPLFGYKSMVFALMSIAGVGYLVWAHHMFTTGMSDFANGVFSFLTFMVAIPTAIKVFNWIGTMYKGSIRITPAMCFALAFIFNFLIGGLTGMFLGSLSTSIYVHDTEFIVAHFHYTMFGGVAFGLIAGVFHYLPKFFGKIYNFKAAYYSFALLFIGFNATYIPMFILGMKGMPRRYHTYPDIPEYVLLQQLSTYGSWIMGLGIFLTLGTLLYTVIKGKKMTQYNPWNSSTLEWQTATPPSLFNWDEEHEPQVIRHPYDFDAFRQEVKDGISKGENDE
ncbi:MAG: cbb3-type cytochrome c oxidase subunit I [Fibrobacterales bacterium]